MTAVADQPIPPPPPHHGGDHSHSHPLTSSASAPLLRHGPAAAEGNAATALATSSAVPPAPGVQMKFVENLIKDSQEELW